MRLRDTTAQEVMTPRVDVVALKSPVTPDDVTRAVKESGHSRFPVCGETLDELLGVLFVKDLFRLGDAPTTELINRRLRKPYLVPEGRRVLDLLQDFRSNRAAFAVVVSEHGGIEGVLTIKDLVSELVGDILDEFDPDPAAEVTRIDAQRWLADGACAVDDVAEALGVELPEGEYVTLGGLLLDLFHRIPAEGDVVAYDGMEFKVAEMDRRRIAKVVVRTPSATVDGSAPEGDDGV